MCFGQKKSSNVKTQGPKPAQVLPPTELAYHVPRTDTSENKPNFVSVNQCNAYLQMAPLPTNVKTYGGKRRPHPHKDVERHYEEEAAKARLVAAKQRPGYDSGQPVLWGYVADNYDYSRQNAKGKSTIGQDEGFKRIIADEYKNQQGLSYHPWDSRARFQRAPVVERPVPPGRRDTGRPGRL